MEFLLYILAGAVVGLAIGLTGVGGGSLMTPLLLMFGYPAPVAIGTDLIYAALTKLGGAYSHHRHGNVDWKIVGWLAIGSIPMSLAVHGLLLNSDFQQTARFEGLLTRSLGFMLITTSFILIFKNKMRESSIKNSSVGQTPGALMMVLQSYPRLITLLMGLLLGVCVTLSSVGAGAFGAAILLLIYAQIPVARVIGTDVAHAVPLTLVAGLGYMAGGFVDYMLLGSLLLGSIPAINLGARMSNRIPDRVLQLLLTVLLMGLGLYYAIFK